MYNNLGFLLEIHEKYQILCVLANKFHYISLFWENFEFRIEILFNAYILKHYRGSLLKITLVFKNILCKANIRYINRGINKTVRLFLDYRNLLIFPIIYVKQGPVVLHIPKCHFPIAWVLYPNFFKYSGINVKFVNNPFGSCGHSTDV